MKPIAFIVVCGFTCLFTKVSAQIFTYEFNDNKTPYYFNLSQDSSKKIWQIGEPTKPQFNTGDNQGFVFCTDLNNPLQPNDTFSFTINFQKLIRTWFEISCIYKKYGAKNDRAIFELSIDSGKSWVNLMDEDTIYDMNWFSDKPDFTQNDSAEWKNADIDLSQWAMNRNNKYQKNFWASNLIQLKISYICDSTQFTNRAGFCIDNLMVASFHWGIQQYNKNKAITLFPNPTAHYINFNNSSGKNIQKITILNYLGKTIFTEEGDDIKQADISGLAAGIYTIIYESDGYNFVDQFIHTTNN